MFKHILCPLDSSSHSHKALTLATDLAKAYDAKISLLHALLRNADTAALQRFVQVEGLSEHVRPEMQRIESVDPRHPLNLAPGYQAQSVSEAVLAQIGQYILNDAESELHKQGVKNTQTLLVDGDPADQILHCINEQGVDCVVMGSRGLSDIKGLFMGSVSHKVSNRTSCTCIAVK